MKRFQTRRIKQIVTFFFAVSIMMTQCYQPMTINAGTKGTGVIKQIKLSKKSVMLDRGKHLQLKVSISPKQAKNEKLIWKSNHSSIVSVSQKGKLTAKKVGTAKITVAVKGTKKRAVCIVKVLIPLSKFSISPTKKTIYVGQKINLKAKVFPKNTSYKKLIYRSKNKNIATVTSKGSVKGKKEGKTTILVQVRGTTKKRKVSIIVKEKASQVSDSSQKPSDYTQSSTPKPPEQQTSKGSVIPSVTSVSGSASIASMSSIQKPTSDETSASQPSTNIPAIPSQIKPSAPSKSTEKP